MRNLHDKSIYQTWSNMIFRCENSNATGYHNYGGRGISVCERWRKSFQAFADDMGLRPLWHSIDRIDPNGNYEPSNCRWASRAEQARNTRRKRIVQIEGVDYHVAELQDKYGVAMKTIYYRASLGWSLEKVVSKEQQWNNTESQKKAVAAHAEMKRAQTHCKNGHELNDENVYLYRGRRACRRCRRAWDRFLYYKRVRPLSEFLAAV